MTQNDNLCMHFMYIPCVELVDAVMLVVTVALVVTVDPAVVVLGSDEVVEVAAWL